jgi:hypothetical protein
MGKIATPLSVCALVLTLCYGCGRVNSAPEFGHASSVLIYNCTHPNDGPTAPPSGRSYNIFTRVDNGAWVPRTPGLLNPQPGAWTDCHDAAHTLGSRLELNLASPPGKWEIRSIDVRRGDEKCDSSAPEVTNACLYETSVFQTDLSAPPATIDLTDSLSR